MIKPTKQAYLKHDLYKVKFPDMLNSTAYIYTDAVEKIQSIIPMKIASKGMKFVWCDTDRLDGAMGWYADDGSGYFRSGVRGFGNMSMSWGETHLSTPEQYVKTKPNDEEDDGLKI